MSVVGIDLGTTNTVVGCVRAGKVHVLADEKGVRLLPSVVSFHPNGEVLVGATAKARRVIDARNTVYSHKRLIGRSWGSKEIGQARARFAFELREGPGQGPLVHARNQDYTLPEISAFVLKRARQIAELALGTSVERAVITVPAHFNELQRASTKVAGRISGLEVLRILNEPTAAALAYGLGRIGSERVAVYDFGGGTFDCTLLDLNGNVFEVLATAGDSFLGGDDIDNLIADRMADTFLKLQRMEVRDDPQLFERLKATAEDVKIALSTAETHTVVLKDFAHGPGGSSLPFPFTLTRRDLEAMITPLIEQSFKVTQDALGLARLSPSSFDKVILVGGSTRIPLVRRRVEQFFGAQPMDRVNPDEVVAIGAAIQAAALTEGVRRRSIPAPPMPARRPMPSDQDITQAKNPLDAATLKPAFGSAPPAFGFASTVGSNPPDQQKTTPPDQRPTAPATAAKLAEAAEMPPAPPPLKPMPSPAATRAAPQPPAATGARPGGGSVHRRTIAGVAPGDLPPTLSTPFEPFGAVKDLSLISTTGITSPGLDEPGDDFGHVSDLSLIAPDTEPRAQARKNIPFDDDDLETQVGASAHKGNTLQLDPADNPAMTARMQGDSPGGAARGSKPDTVRGRGEIGATTSPMPVVQKPPALTKAEASRTSPMKATPHERPQIRPASGAHPKAPEPPPAARPQAPPPPPPMQHAMPSAPPAPVTSYGPSPGPGRPPPMQQPSAYASAPPPMQSHFASQPPLQAPPQGFASAPPNLYPSAPPPQRALPSAPPLHVQQAPPPPAPAPAHATQMSPQQQPSAPTTGHPAYVPPVLVDVTPRALIVETVGGYIDTIIPRNAKIPCERTRRFTTGRDMQTTVRVRVAQGENQTFSDNTFLGEVELSGLRPAARGDVTVAVTFEVDADGTLRVRAADVQTGIEARATLQLIGIADESSVVMMINRFAHQPVASGPSQ